MLRYTTIHHDVRSRFKLTIAEYMVADSIMQQTKYHESCKQGPTEMGEWLDITKETVIRAKKRLQNEGLIVETGGGFITSNDFVNAIRFASGDKMSPKGDKMSPAHIYINKEITSEQSSQACELSKETEQVEDDFVFETDEELLPIKPKKTRARKDAVLLEVFTCFGEKIPSWWFSNNTQRTSAKALLEERGIDQIKKALSFYEARKDEPFCPQILTPRDLDTKWEHLLRFKSKKHV